MRFAFFLFFSACAVAGIAGCDPGVPVGPHPCTAQSDCRTGQVCVDGHCAAPTDSGMDRPDSAFVFPDTGPPVDADTAPRCGDGRLRVGEDCDDGNLDDGDGCDHTCMLEPNYTCPTPGSPCVSTIVCGDGVVVSPTEGCDDRNTMPGDGCDAHCQLEAGWTCMTAGLPCTAAMCGDGIVAGTEDCEDGGAPPVSGDGCDASCHFEEGFACGAPGTACVAVVCGNGTREGTEQCDDGNHDLGDGCDPFCHREPMCTDGTCTAVCGDGVLLPGEDCDDGNLRDGDGCDHTCTTEMGFTCMPSGGMEPSSLAIPIVYRDFRGNDLSGGHADFENALGDDRGIVSATFDAMRKPAYAHAGSTTPTTHGQALFDMWYRDTPGQNMTVIDRLTLTRTAPATYVFDSGAFFPLDTAGFVAAGTEPLRLGHNFSFTSELRYWFTYAGGETLTFRGDDDVWVFINGRLALDIGGVHGAETASITLDATAAGTLGMHTGGIYEACVFQAERHTSASSYQLTLVGFDATHSTCNWTCGDGIVTRYEICDDMVNDGSYGHCLPGCLGFGPHCGDAHVDTANGEECDDGTNTGAYGHCAPGCVLGPRCGDHVVQTANGEQCDDGNTTPGDGCDASCQNEVH